MVESPHETLRVTVPIDQADRNDAFDRLAVSMASSTALLQKSRTDLAAWASGLLKHPTTLNPDRKLVWRRVCVISLMTDAGLSDKPLGAQGLGCAV